MPAESATNGDGCVSFAMMGDLRGGTMITQGAKPFGGVYCVVAAGKSSGNTKQEDNAARSTINAIVLDEVATMWDANAEDFDAEESEDEDAEVLEDEKEAKRAKLLSDYTKARIPKLPLAEATFVMERLSDDDQAFMRKASLIRLEMGSGSMA